MTPIEILESTLKILKENEWSTRDAPENKFCRYCEEEDELWGTHKVHGVGCKWVETVSQLEAYLRYIKDTDRTALAEYEQQTLKP